MTTNTSSSLHNNSNKTSRINRSSFNTVPIKIHTQHQQMGGVVAEEAAINYDASNSSSVQEISSTVPTSSHSGNTDNKKSCEEESHANQNPQVCK